MPIWFFSAEEEEAVPASEKDWIFGGSTVPADWTLSRAGTAMGRDASGRWKSFAANVPRPYRTPITSDTEGTYLLGTAAGGSTLSGGEKSLSGTVTLKFTAASSVTHLQVQRATAGFISVSDVQVKATPTPSWVKAGPGTMSVASNGDVTVTGTGGAETTATQSLNTIPGRQYTVVLSSTAAVTYSVIDAP